MISIFISMGILGACNRSPTDGLPQPKDPYAKPVDALYIYHSDLFSQSFKAICGERTLNYHIDREDKRTMFLGITTKESCTLKYGQSILEPVYGGEEYDCSFSETEMDCKKR